MLTRLEVRGYRALAEVAVDLGALTVLIGPNATGKSSLVDVLSFLSEAAEGPILPPLGARGGLRSLLWNGGATEFSISVTMDLGTRAGRAGAAEVHYSLVVAGLRFATEPVVASETFTVTRGEPGDVQGSSVVLAREGARATVVRGWSPQGGGEPTEVDVREQHLLLPTVWAASDDPWAFGAAMLIGGIQARGAWDVGPGSALRRPYDPAARTSSDTCLHPDGRNLVGVLSVLKSDLSYADHMAQLDEWLGLAFPEYDGLGVTHSVAGPEVALQWREQGREALHAGQLSDGLLRFLALGALCASPVPPSVVTFDEPELGLHPRLLPLVGAMFRTLAERTQVVLITHSPTLLEAFPLESIVVMSKDNDGCHIHRPSDDAALVTLLGPTVGDTVGDLFLRGDLDHDW